MDAMEDFLARVARRDPACGGPLDRDLHCPACGHVDGVFGQALAAFAAKRRTPGSA